MKLHARDSSTCKRACERTLGITRASPLHLDYYDREQFLRALFSTRSDPHLSDLGEINDRRSGCARARARYDSDPFSAYGESNNQTETDGGPSRAFVSGLQIVPSSASISSSSSSFFSEHVHGPNYRGKSVPLIPIVYHRETRASKLRHANFIPRNPRPPFLG